MELVDVNIDSVTWALLLREAARGNPSARKTLEEYLAQSEGITELAAACLGKLSPGDSNWAYYHLLGIAVGAFRMSLDPRANPAIDPYAPPSAELVAPHENALRRLAAFHNRAAGKRKNTKPGLLNAIARFFESSVESEVPDMDPEDRRTKDLLPQLLEAMRKQLNYANSLSWGVG